MIKETKFTGKVAAAIIENNGKYFIAKRAKKDSLIGLWEFPGGKQEEGETIEECLKRELKEEFNIEANVGNFICSSKFEYKNKKMELLAFKIESFKGTIECLEHEEIKWISINELKKHSFPDPDLVIIKTLEKKI